MKKPKFSKILAIILSGLLIFQQTGFAQVAAVELNIAGRFADFGNSFTPDKFRPLHLRSISYDGLNNDFKLLLDKGSQKQPQDQEVQKTAKELLNYFFVGIALPNDAFWVNLRPDSPNDIIDPFLAQTDVGKVLLEADLQLKKDTANATNPGTPLGREYWNKLYQKAAELYGTQNVTIPTLTRPWIIPDEVVIRESADSAYVYKATLKVMLEQDHLKDNSTYAFKDEREKQLNEYSAQLIREKIIPKLTKEINSAKRYAPLRQVYYSLILAQWFKARNHNDSNQYARRINRKDLSGLQSPVPFTVDTYFNAYKENFAKGQYNIKEPVSTAYGQAIRSYFSGGAELALSIPSLGQTASVNSNGTVVSVIPDSGGSIAGNNSLIIEAGAGQEVRRLMPDEGRQDASRRSAIDGITGRIDDYNGFEIKINNLIAKLNKRQAFDSGDIEDLKDLQKRLLLKNFLVAMQDKVKPEDMVIVINQGAIKALNTQIGQPNVDLFIKSRQDKLMKLLVAEGLITADGVLSLSFKQDRFVIKGEVVARLGRTEVLARLNKVAQTLTSQLTNDLRNTSEFSENSTIQEYVFSFNLGLSAPVQADNDDARQLADLQALQAAKMERLGALEKDELMFNQERFDELMFEADNLRQELWLAPGELPAESEMKEVRERTEAELASELAKGIAGAQRAFSLKRYLDIIDLFDYPKSWRRDADRRSEEKEAISSILEGLKYWTGPPGSVGQAGTDPDPGIIQDALAVIKTNSKNHRLTSGEAFFAKAAELSEKDDGRLIAVDVIGFWADIQANLAKAHQEYMSKIGSSEFQKQALALNLALDTDDLIKRKMAEHVDALIGELGGYIPVIELNGQQRLLINQEGGDEIVLYLHGQHDWGALAGRLSELNLGVRIMAAVVAQGDVFEQERQRLLGLAYTEITNGYFGDVYITAQEADKKVKALEKNNIFSAVVSQEANAEWFVYYRGQKAEYDEFYRGLVQRRGFGPGTPMVGQFGDPGEEGINPYLAGLSSIDAGMRRGAYDNILAIARASTDAQRRGIAVKLITAQEDLIKARIGPDSAGPVALIEDLIKAIEPAATIQGPSRQPSFTGQDELALEQYIKKGKGNMQQGFPEVKEFKILPGYAHRQDDLKNAIDRGDIIKVVLNDPSLLFPVNPSWTDYYKLSLRFTTFAGLILEALFPGNRHDSDVQIVFTIRELLKNAFVHGNLGNINIPVYIYIDRGGRKLEVWNPKIEGDLSPEALGAMRQGQLTGKGHGLEDSIGSPAPEYLPIGTKVTASYMTPWRIAEERDRSDQRPPQNPAGRGGSPVGGIDFRFLPIVVQSMDSLKASIRTIPINSLQRIDLTREWNDIERLVGSGITPSAQRLKEYLAASCIKDSSQRDLEKIVACIADILRMQEETGALTDQTLKDILVVLGSGRSTQDLKLAFAN